MTSSYMREALDLARKGRSLASPNPLVGAVLVRDGANIGVVAHQMAQLVDAVGHVLTPQLRDDLRRLNMMTGGAGR